MRLIDADVLNIDFYDEYETEDDEYTYAYVSKSQIDNAPTIDAVEVVHGKWIPLRGRYAECSACEEAYYMPHLRWSNFCPCCGAKMGGERKESE